VSVVKAHHNPSPHDPIRSPGTLRSANHTPEPPRRTTTTATVVTTIAMPARVVWAGDPLLGCTGSPRRRATSAGACQPPEVDAREAARAIDDRHVGGTTVIPASLPRPGPVG
jgi:hypothetical protein